MPPAPLPSRAETPSPSLAARTRAALIEALEPGQGARDRNLPMEGLRGAAVGLVFLVHYNGLFGGWLAAGSASQAVSNFLWSIGHAGVDLFFVLSGYLIYGSAIRSSQPYLRFMRRRVRRIYPTFLVVLGIYLLLSFVFPSESKVPPGFAHAARYVAANVLLLPGLFAIPPIVTVAWSLSYEFFYYLAIPILVAAGALRERRPSTRIGFFGALAVAAVVYAATGAFAHVRLIMFVAGILLYERLHSIAARERRGQDAALGITLLIVLPLIYVLQDRPDVMSSVPGAGHTGGIARAVVLFGAFYWLTLRSFTAGSAWARIFSVAPLRRLGNMSYSYYLVHGLTLKFIAMVALRVRPPAHPHVVLFWCVLPAAFAATLVSSLVLYLCVERRFSLAPARVVVDRPASELADAAAAA